MAFRADRETTDKIRQVVPGARFQRGSCQVKIDGRQPGEVADRARAVLDAIRPMKAERI